MNGTEPNWCSEIFSSVNFWMYTFIQVDSSLRIFEDLCAKPNNTSDKNVFKMCDYCSLSTLSFFTDFKYIFLDYGLNHVSPLPSHSLVVLYNGNWEQNNLSIAWRHKDTILLQASLFSKETIFIKKHENRGHSQHPLPERDRTPKSILARKNIKSLQTLEL